MLWPLYLGSHTARAVYNSAMLEELAKMALYALAMKPGIPVLSQALIDKHYQRKHGSDAYYGQG